MKISLPLLNVLAIFLLSGCVMTTNYSSETESMDFSQTATLLTEFSGIEMLTDIQGFKIKVIESEHGLRKERILFDKTKLILQPGKYLIELDTWLIPGILMPYLAGPRLPYRNVPIDPQNSNIKVNDQNQFKIEVQAGYLYVIKPVQRGDEYFVEINQY